MSWNIDMMNAILDEEERQAAKEWALEVQWMNFEGGMRESIEMQYAFDEEIRRREDKKARHMARLASAHQRAKAKAKVQSTGNTLLIEEETAKPVIIAPRGSVRTRKTVVCPDGWEIVVSNNTVLET